MDVFVLSVIVLCPILEVTRRKKLFLQLLGCKLVNMQTSGLEKWSSFFGLYLGTKRLSVHAERNKWIRIS